MRRVVVAFLLVALPLFAASVPEAEFLSPFYERPDLQRLEARLAELRQQSNLNAHLATQVLAFHVYLTALGERRPHLAARSLASLTEACDAWVTQNFATFQGEPALAARAGYLCAWAAAERMASANWEKIFLISRVDLCLFFARRNALPDAERNYLEARVQLALPPGWGRETRRPLVLLTFLSAQYPAHVPLLSALAAAHYSVGNFDAAKANGITLSRSDVDRDKFGVAPGLFLTPADGAGLVVQGRDDRLFDGARSLDGSAAVTTRGSFVSRVAYRDEAVFTGSTLSLGFAFAREQRDFFSLGIASPSASRTRNLATGVSGYLSGTVPVVSPVTLEVGWYAENQQIEDAPLAVDAIFGARGFTYGGPFAEMKFDTRDSARDPWRGLDFSVRGIFPAAGLGSSVSFERWDFGAAYYATLSRAHHFQFHALVASASAAAPLSAYPVLAGRGRAPGVRADRYRDRKSFFADVEYQIHSESPFRAAAFGTLGSVGTTFSDAFRGPIGVGGGIALLVQPSRDRATPLRAELGVFKGEWVFQVLASAGI